MTNQLENILQQAGLKTNAFPSTSRYYSSKIATMETVKGNVVNYLRRRILPQTNRFSVITEHSVKEGDRLDNITNSYLGDPEQFWRLCDANGALNPDELTEIPGTSVNITLPEGITGF